MPEPDLAATAVSRERRPRSTAAGPPPGAELSRLGDELARVGYGDFLSCFDPLSPDPRTWRAYRAAAPARLEPVIDLFLLGGTVDPEGLPANLGALVPTLQETGLLVEDQGGNVRMPGLIVLLVFGHWLICQPPQPDPLFYFGEDSVALLTRLLVGTARTQLDLCTGPGIHAIHGARFGARVTAVDHNPLVAQLAALNARLNRVAARMEVLAGDLFEPVAGRRFDVVSANPPALPYPSTLPAPAVGSGGEDGMQTTWQVLDGLPAALTDGGRAHIAGMTLSDGRAIRVVDRLKVVARLNRLAVRCTVLSHTRLAPADDLFERIVAAISAISSGRPESVRSSYLEMLARLGADHLCTFFLHVRQGDGEVEIIDLARRGPARLWYV